VLYPVSWSDALEILPANKLSFLINGLQVPGSQEDNLCMKAYRLLMEFFNLPPVQIILLKSIPPGAGLGGGSSDGVTTIKMLNKLFGLNLSADQLQHYAVSLGSDCPFFIEEKSCIVTGRGELMEPFAVDLSGLYLKIIYPKVEISTAWAFKQLSSRRQFQTIEDLNDRSEHSIKSVIRATLTEWRDHLKNEFEDVVFMQYPQIADIKKKMYEEGAVYASLSGSGSAVYGLFEELPQINGDPRFIQFTSRL